MLASLVKMLAIAAKCNLKTFLIYFIKKQHQNVLTSIKTGKKALCDHTITTVKCEACEINAPRDRRATLRLAIPWIWLSCGVQCDCRCRGASVSLFLPPSLKQRTLKRCSLWIRSLITNLHKWPSNRYNIQHLWAKATGTGKR